MILRIYKSILLFFGRIFDNSKHKRIEIVILPEIDPMASFENTAESRRISYGQDIFIKDNNYLISDQHI